MKSIIIISALVCSCINSTGQSNPLRIDQKDSIELIRVFKIFTSAIEKNDKTSIRKISLRIVDCVVCNYKDPENGFYNYTPIDIFIDTLLNEMPNSELWNEIKENRFFIRGWTFEKFYPRSLPNHRKAKLSLYMVCFSWLPEDMKESGEGVTHYFQFVKLNNAFKLYGWDIIP